MNAGLEKICLCAFTESALEAVILPSSVKSVSYGVFAKCESLRTVTLNEGLEKLGTREVGDS